MGVEITEVGVEDLARYSRVSIAFEVTSVLQVRLPDSGLGGMVLSEVDIDRPYTKDYDSYEDGGPERWSARFDVSNWGFFLAAEGAQVIGGVVVAFDTPGVHMLCDRHDLAVLWDLRVHPAHRGQGVGTLLFHRAASWSRERGCVQLMAETQNVNVPACRFYTRRGCELCQIDRCGYFGHPKVGHEVKLVWCLDL